MGHKETVYGCDVPGHPNNYTHEHDSDDEGIEFLALMLVTVVRAALNLGGYVVVKRAGKDGD